CAAAGSADDGRGDTGRSTVNRQHIARQRAADHGQGSQIAVVDDGGGQVQDLVPGYQSVFHHGGVGGVIHDQGGPSARVIDVHLGPQNILDAMRGVPQPVQVGFPLAMNVDDAADAAAAYKHSIRCNTGWGANI